MRMATIIIFITFIVAISVFFYKKSLNLQPNLARIPIAVTKEKQDTPSKSQDLTTDPCQQSREQNGKTVEVIYTRSKSATEIDGTKFEDIKWVKHTDKDLGISFDFPKDIYILEKVTSPLDNHIEKEGLKDYSFMFTNCVNYSFAIHFIYDNEGYYYTNLRFSDPEKFYLNNPERFYGKVTDTKFNGFKAKLFVNNVATQIPADELLVYFYKSGDTNTDHLVNIVYPKKDIDAYLQHTKSSWNDNELERYKNFDTRIAERVLNSISFDWK